ncbi:heme ABC transporter ATP-binding protein [Microbacterium saperdae]|uniref:Iron complex transport system ATP-binding protein n=1 Tax=Microbacterium saperdae TaxID=69368 RepID=A0A543BBV9_9MICO|nr:heme ABC transporter ATP-binding protein [Microbacterium saperdae]TQL82282.1 iron complex transport system ATP-binding protein [Microbacterium saperdae]GGM38546.1 hemin import ATP-binding protein HmuV [Microbacterium saperdae]
MSVRLRGTGLTVRVGGGRAILDDASIDIRAGEIHALVGPNGAGKSTLFGVLAGDVTTQSGEVTLDETPIADIRPQTLARARAVLLQENAVSFPFTAEQVVRMGRAPWARTESVEQDDAIVAEAMEATEVASLAARPVTSLSGGERARVALARVLAQSTGILLLDEPTAALDLKHHEDVMRLIRAQADAGIAVAIVLHDLNAALAHADRVTLLAGGRVAASGTADEVLTAERIEAVYGQPVDVFPHPLTGVPLVVARR